MLIEEQYQNRLLISEAEQRQTCLGKPTAAQTSVSEPSSDFTTAGSSRHCQWKALSGRGLEPGSLWPELGTRWTHSSEEQVYTCRLYWMMAMRKWQENTHQERFPLEGSGYQCPGLGFTENSKAPQVTLTSWGKPRARHCTCGAATQTLPRSLPSGSALRGPLEQGSSRRGGMLTVWTR